MKAWLDRETEDPKDAGAPEAVKDAAAETAGADGGPQGAPEDEPTLLK